MPLSSLCFHSQTCMFMYACVHTTHTHTWEVSSRLMLPNMSKALGFILKGGLSVEPHFISHSTPSQPLTYAALWPCGVRVLPPRSRSR